MSALFTVRTVYLERLFSVCIFKTVEWVYIVQRVWFFESVYCLEHALYVFFCSYILTVHIFWYFNVGVRDNPAASLYGLATVGVCNSTITTGGEAAVFPRVSPRLCGKMARNVAPLSYLQVGRWAAWCQRRRSVSTLAECCWIKSGNCTVAHVDFQIIYSSIVVRAEFIILVIVSNRKLGHLKHQNVPSMRAGAWHKKVTKPTRVQKGRNPQFLKKISLLNFRRIEMNSIFFSFFMKCRCSTSEKLKLWLKEGKREKKLLDRYDDEESIVAW